MSKLPPIVSVSLLLFKKTLWLDFRHHTTKGILVQTGRQLSPIVKVNYPSRRGTIRPRIKILTIKVREEYLLIARICRDPLDSFFRLENETLTKHYTSLEGNFCVFRETFRFRLDTPNRL